MTHPIGEREAKPRHRNTNETYKLIEKVIERLHTDDHTQMTSVPSLTITRYVAPTIAAIALNRER